MLKVFPFMDDAFGGCFVELPPNSPFSGRNRPPLKANLGVVKNCQKKWHVWAWFISLSELYLKGLNISNNYFGGSFPKLHHNAKIVSNSPFSGGNRLPLKTNFVVVIFT